MKQWDEGIAQRCPSCGVPVKTQGNYCGVCGMPLEGCRPNNERTFNLKGMASEMHSGDASDNMSRSSQLEVEDVLRSLR